MHYALMTRLPEGGCVGRRFDGYRRMVSDGFYIVPNSRSAGFLMGISISYRKKRETCA